MNLRACRETSRTTPATCDSFSLAKALQFAIQNRAQIVNLSLTGPEDRLLGVLVDLAIHREIAVVAAYDPGGVNGGFPASWPGVVAVAGEGLENGVPRVYEALGRDVPTTMAGGSWGLVNGNSFAVAHVTGLLALTRERQGATSGAPTLVAARVDGGRVNPYATVAGTRRPCGNAPCAVARGAR